MVVMTAMINKEMHEELYGSDSFKIGSVNQLVICAIKSE